MTHPIVALQGSLVAALRTAGIAVFDTPPPGSNPPFALIARHDLLPRDGDDAPGHEHRMTFHIWADTPSRKAALSLAETVLGICRDAPLDPAGLVVTLRRHDGTSSLIDGPTGRARAALALSFLTEPQ